MTTRRDLLVALGAGVLAAPLPSFAQQPAGVPLIAYLGTNSAPEYVKLLEALRSGLRDFGYIEGQNIVIEYRYADGDYARLSGLAAELVRLKVNAIVTHGTPGMRAAKQATATIPIVMAYSGDAVATGLIASIARPGGNITGSTFFNPELGAKRLELLKEIMPHLKRAAVLVNADNPVNAIVLQAMEAAAKSLKLELQSFAVHTTNELDAAFSTMAKKRIEAVVMTEDPFLSVHVGQIVRGALKSRVISIGYGQFAESGGLMVYGANLLDMVHRSAYFIDRILKGAKPAELPVEQPTRFELIVNLKTAAALGIRIPQSILVRADQVIE